MIKQIPIRIGYRLLILGICFYTLFLSISRHTMIGLEYDFSALWYYPQWNVLLMLIAYGYLTVKTISAAGKKEHPKLPELPLLIRGMFLVSMLLSMVYYILLLHPFLLIHKPETYHLTMFVILPLLLYADWILFSNPTVIRLNHVLFWMLEPVCYLLVVFLRAQYGKVLLSLSTKYIYPILDIDRLGTIQVAKNVYLLMMLWICCSMGLLLLNRIKHNKKPN